MPSLAATLKEHAERTPDAPYVVHLATDTTLSFAGALATAEKLTTVLASMGVGKRDKVAFIVRNHWLLFPLLLACNARRATLVPVDPELHRDERAFILADAAPMLVVHLDGTPPPSVKGKPTIRTLGELLAALNAAARSEPLVEHDPNDVALMIYTSGTTGTNKCVMLTGGNLVTNASALAARYGVRADDRFYCTLPTHHMNAIMMTGMVPLVAGARVYLSDILSFKNAKRYWSHVAELGVTVCSLVPSIMALLLKLSPRGATPGVDRAARRADAPSPHSVRFGFCGAAPLPAHTWKQFEEVFGFPIYQGYGLTETTCWATSSLPDGPRRWDSVGVPLDCCEVLIDAAPVAELDSFLFTKNSLASPEDAPKDGEVGFVSGEVLIRGPIVGPGYFRNPKLTKESTTSEGFFRTGDLGYFDAQGHLHISGRLKEIIIKNGANVFATDVDRVLAQHPAVETSKTIGVRDELVGERIVSACVVREGHTLSDQDLRSWAQERLSPHMWPDAFEFLGFLPAGAAGKVSTNVLRKIVTGELAEEILGSLNSWKYKRAQPSDMDRLREIVQHALVRGTPIPFLSYWGCGVRDNLSDLDRMALERLHEYAQGVKRLPQISSVTTLIFTDTHARNNRIPEERMNRYFEAIRGHAEGLGMRTVLMSELWADAGLTVSKIQEAAKHADFEAAWSAHPLRDRLIDQAGKHVEEGGDPAHAAKHYLATCSQESRALAERFAGGIFATYNHPDFDCVSPLLPKVYLSSFKEGTSVKPWFA
ncbi:MAG TPA: class I adenylate-forming enzyme family protein [Polyangiaceae bacterium]|jgi:acyl-CoA synthetase (AMP-forming)/AMP-acid ligase II